MSIHSASSWEVKAQTTFVAIVYEGSIVGFCQPESANKIVRSLNEAETLQKALQLACYDLIARSGGSSESVADLMARYRSKVQRPIQGTALIALMLKERQTELDLNDDEFAKFCDSYRLSRRELRNIYADVEVESEQLIPLSRILGCTIDQVIEAWKGS